MAQTQTKEYAHELIDRMAPGQVSVVVNLLEVMLDPFARALANAPYDDEPVSEEEMREVDLARKSLSRGEGTSHEEMLREFGMCEDEFSLNQTPPTQSQSASR